MGLSSSVLDMDRLSELVSETMGLFAKTFPVAYRDAIIESIKQESAIICRKGWELSAAPQPAHYLKRGYLTKQGHSVKSWKRRLFTALNAADNYMVVYHVDENEVKERGRIECFGCRVEAFSPDEEVHYGRYGFKVVPYLEKNRSWFIVADSEEDKIEWQAIFANACRKASPRVHEDPVIARAFLKALERTRKAYHFYGCAELVGSEVESLSSFVIQVLLRELLDETFSAIKSTSRRVSSINSARVVVEGIVSEAAAITWGKCIEGAKNIEAGLRQTVYDNLPLILDTEERIINTLKRELRPVMEPVVNDLISGSVRPFINVIFDHVVSVHSAAVEGFWLAMRAWVQRYTSPLDAREWNWNPLVKHLPATQLVTAASSPSRFNAKEDSNWSKQYQQYGVKDSKIDMKTKSRSGSFSNTAYTRHRSFTGADAQPVGTPLKRSASMPYEVDSESLTLSGQSASAALSNSDASVAAVAAAAVHGMSPDKSKLQKRIINEYFKCHVDVDDISNGPLMNCALVLWNLYTGDLGQLNEGSLSDSLSAYDVYTYELDSLQALLHNAIYTLELMTNSIIEDVTPEVMHGLIRDVTVKLILDAKKSMIEGLNALSHDLIRCTCQEIIEGPCIDVATELKLKIPAPIQDVLNVDNLVEITTTNQVQAILSHIISEIMFEQKMHIVSPF